MKKHGKLHQEYLDRRSTVRPIKANNKNLKAIVTEEIQKLGYNADLNHIDVFEVTSMSSLLKKYELASSYTRRNFAFLL